VPSCRDQGWAAGSAQGARGPRGLRPSCPPLPESNELVDVGASPADQRWAIIASAKDLALIFLPLPECRNIELGQG